LKNIVEKLFNQSYSLMEPAAILSISIGAVLVAVTGFAVYTSFGPPSRELDDPFEDHED
jgi:PsbN protein